MDVEKRTVCDIKIEKDKKKIEIYVRTITKLLEENIIITGSLKMIMVKRKQKLLTL